MQMPEIELPAAALLAAMLANDAVEPALQPAREVEIRAVDGQHERVVQNGPVEPVRHDQVDAVGLTVRVGVLRPFVDPGETVHPPLAGLA
jgi:hypothetical protein